MVSAVRGKLTVKRVDGEIEGRLIGVRAQDRSVVHMLWTFRPGELDVETTCSRKIKLLEVEFVHLGDLGRMLRPCRQCYSKQHLEMVRRQLDWAVAQRG